MPDPLDLLGDELAAADTDAMRASADLVWGTTGAPSPVTKDVARSIDAVGDRFDTTVAGHWDGTSYQAFAAAVDTDRAAVHRALERCATVGDVSLRAADAIEYAYTDAMTTCLDASARVAELAAGRPSNERLTDLAIAKVISKTVEHVAGHCRAARSEIEDLTPRLEALTDEPVTPHNTPDAGWDRGTGWQPSDDHQGGPQPVGRVHVVGEGDTLWDIAARHLGDPTRWPEIYALNSDQIADPDLIHPGQHLLIPGADPPAAPEAGPPTGPHPAPPLPSPPSDGQGNEPPTRAPEPPPEPTPPRAAPAGPNEPATEPRGLDLLLPSGAWVAVGLATAVLAAWAIAILRRHPRIRPDAGQNTDPLTQPPLIARLRDLLGHRAETHQPTDARYGAPLPAIDDRPDPGVNVAEWARGGLGITGPGGTAAVRAAIAGTLCAGGPLTPQHRGTVVTTSDTLTALLDNLDCRDVVNDVRRLITVRDTDEVIQWLQVEIVRRRRLLDEHGAATFDQLPNADPYATPLAPVLAVLATPPPNRHHGLKALLEEGEPLGVSALLLGDWPSASVFVDGDGYSTSNNTPQPSGRLSTLTAADLRDALQVAAAAAETPGTATDDDLLLTQLPDQRPTASNTPAPPTIRTPPSPQPHPTKTAEEASTPAEPPVDPLIQYDESIPDIEAALTNGHRHKHIDTEPTPQPAQEAEPTSSVDPMPRPDSRPIQLRVLGHVTIATKDGPITHGVRSDSRALLALLAAYPAGRTMEQIIATIDNPADVGAPARCRTAVTALRKVIRRATSDTDPTRKFILRENGVYRIDPDMFNVDLWRVRGAIDAANHAADEPTQLAHLRKAATAYTESFAAGHDWHWAEEHATRLRDDILEVLDRITEITENDRPELATTALRAAITNDPAGEARYQTLMRILGRLKRTDAVRQVLNLCYTNLASIGAQPGPATLRVASRQLR